MAKETKKPKRKQARPVAKDGALVLAGFELATRGVLKSHLGPETNLDVRPSRRTASRKP